MAFPCLKCVCVCVGGGGVAQAHSGSTIGLVPQCGYSHFFFIRRLPPKNIGNIRKIFEIFATPKAILILYIYLKKRPRKIHRKTPKTSPILWWRQKNIHKIFIPKKKLIFLKNPKILKFKILDPKKWPEPTYVSKYTPPPPLGLSIRLYYKAVN